MRLLTHLLLGHVRGSSHGPTLAAQHDDDGRRWAGEWFGSGGRGGNGRNAGVSGAAVLGQGKVHVMHNAERNRTNV